VNSGVQLAPTSKEKTAVALQHTCHAVDSTCSSCHRI